MALQRFNTFESFIQAYLPDRQVVDRYQGPGRTNPVYKTVRHSQRSNADLFHRWDGKTRQVIKSKQYADRHSAIVNVNIEWLKDTTPQPGGYSIMRKLYPQLASISDSLTPADFEVVVYYRSTGLYFAADDCISALWPTQSIFTRVDYYSWANDPDAILAIGLFYLITHIPTKTVIPCHLQSTYLTPLPGAQPLTNYCYINGKHIKLN